MSHFENVRKRYDSLKSQLSQLNIDLSFKTKKITNFKFKIDILTAELNKAQVEMKPLEDQRETVKKQIEKIDQESQMLMEKVEVDGGIKTQKSKTVQSKILSYYGDALLGKRK